MKFHLIDCWNRLRAGKQLGQMPDREIANANRPRLALGAQRFERCASIAGVPAPDSGSGKDRHNPS